MAELHSRRMKQENVSEVLFQLDNWYQGLDAIVLTLIASLL